MTLLIDIMLPLFFLFIMLVAIVGAGCAAWVSLPDTGRATLKQALTRVTGRQASNHREGQVYAVHVDGQLRYAAGQDDVQHFLLVTMTTASRQVLRMMTDDQPATLVFTSGTESVVIEVHLA